MSPQQVDGPGRPFDVNVHAELLRATRDLLVEVGYEQMTIEAVARRCGSGKAAIYRRWSGKPALVVAAALDVLPVPEVPDTGSLRGDLLAAGRAWLGDEGRPQTVVSIVLAAGRHHPDLDAIARAELLPRVENVVHLVLARALQQGAVSLRVDIGVVSDVVPVFAFHRAANLGAPLDDDLLVRLVDSVLLPAVRT